MSHVLMITHDKKFSKQITDLLAGGSFPYTLAQTPAEGLMRFLSEEFCLIVFDMSQPDRSEKEMLQYMISNSNVPVLLISEKSTTK